MRNFLITALVGLTFIVVVRHLVPMDSAFEFDLDEGRNLAKALLMSKGYSLYSQIWSDQPPFMTWLLRGLFGITGFSIVAARWMTLCSAAALVMILFMIVRLQIGLWPGILAAVILTLSNFFIICSVPVMIGMLSLALLTASYLALQLAERKTTARSRYLLLGVSGALSSLSLATKLITGPWVLLLLVKLALNRSFASRRDALMLWLAAFVITSLPFVLLTPGKAFHMLIFPHLNAFSTDSANPSSALKYATWDLGFLLLAGTAPIFSTFYKIKDGWIPVAWLLLGELLLFTAHPLQYHYYPIVGVGIAWLGAVGASQASLLLSEFYRKRSNTPLNLARVAIVTLVTLWIIIWTFPGKVTYNFGYHKLLLAREPTQQAATDRVVETLKQNAASSPWVLTDRPMFALRAGLLVPPEIAVISKKRLQSEWGSDALPVDFLSAIGKKYNFPPLLLARYARDKQFAEYLNEHYQYAGEVFIDSKTTAYFYQPRTTKGQAR